MLIHFLREKNLASSSSLGLFLDFTPAERLKTCQTLLNAFNT